MDPCDNLCATAAPMISEYDETSFLTVALRLRLPHLAGSQDGYAQTRVASRICRWWHSEKSDTLGPWLCFCDPSSVVFRVYSKLVA